MVRFLKFYWILIIPVIVLVLNPFEIDTSYASEKSNKNSKFTGAYKVKSPNGNKIFYIGWTAKGAAIKYGENGKVKILVDFNKEDLLASYDKNQAKHIEIDKDNLYYHYFYRSFEHMSFQETICRFVNNGYWLDLICEGAYGGGSSVPFYSSWIITYDGRVFSLKQQEEFIKKHNVKYNSKLLKKKIKYLSNSFGSKYAEDFKPDGIRIGVDKKGNAILGFVFTETPSISDMGDAYTRSLVGITLWTKAYPKNAFDSLKSNYKIERCSVKKKNCPFKKDFLN